MEFIGHYTGAYGILSLYEVFVSTYRWQTQIADNDSSIFDFLQKNGRSWTIDSTAGSLLVSDAVHTDATPDIVQSLTAVGTGNRQPRSDGLPHHSRQPHHRISEGRDGCRSRIQGQRTFPCLPSVGKDTSETWIGSHQQHITNIQLHDTVVPMMILRIMKPLN